MLQEKMIIGIVSGVTIAALTVAGVGFGWVATHRNTDAQSPNTNSVALNQNINTANTDEATNVNDVTPQNTNANDVDSADETSTLIPVQLYFVLIDDRGAQGTAIGCGDSVSSVDITIPTTSNPVRAALKQLLSVREQYYGKSELYNALYQSELRVKEVTVENGRAAVYLTGELLSGGTCDDPRIREQIKQTVLQFSDIQTVDIFVNDTPIETLLSGKGDE